ncbi:hypothetical protein C8J57DRAFT_1532686 [Mycena rebaudengoi]|nr:hypothetical protein C8J57DRAFT_1532686 [Mycena rebaudengoi]
MSDFSSPIFGCGRAGPPSAVCFPPSAPPFTPRRRLLCPRRRGRRTPRPALLYRNAAIQSEIPAQTRGFDLLPTLLFASKDDDGDESDLLAPSGRYRPCSETPHKAGRSLRIPLTSAVRAPPHDLGMLPSMHIDILYEVLRHLHPIDLIHLSRTSTDFCVLLLVCAAAPLWRDAFRSLRLTVPPPPPPSTAPASPCPPSHPTTAPHVPVISLSASSAPIAHTPPAPPPPSPRRHIRARSCHCESGTSDVHASHACRASAFPRRMCPISGGGEQFGRGPGTHPPAARAPPRRTHSVASGLSVYSNSMASARAASSAANLAAQLQPPSPARSRTYSVTCGCSADFGIPWNSSARFHAPPPPLPPLPPPHTPPHYTPPPPPLWHHSDSADRTCGPCPPPRSRHRRQQLDEWIYSVFRPLYYIPDTYVPVFSLIPPA